MKVELSSGELQVLLAPGERAHAEVVRLTAENVKLQAEIATVQAGPTGSDSNQNLANVLANVCGALANGNKITAIKLVREFTHLGLPEAKDIVEGNYNGPGITRVV